MSLDENEKREIEKNFNEIRFRQFVQPKSIYSRATPPTPPLEMIRALENATNNYSSKSNTQTNSPQHNSDISTNIFSNLKDNNYL